MVNTWKFRVEATGLIVSFAGLASILQPFNYIMYNLGFYTLAIGAAIYFLGSTVPEEASRGRIFIKIVAIITFVGVIMLLAIYLAPMLVS